MQRVLIKNRKGLDLVILYSIAQEKTRGLIFIEHGFTGHKEQPHIKTIADAFIDNNYSVVIFDATNSVGESGTSEEGITFTSHYNDLEDVINWSRTQDWYQEPFVLSGHSLGGLSVIYYTENYPQKVRLLIPVSPVINGKAQYESRKKSMGEKFDEWKNGKPYEKYSESTGKTIKVPFSFMEDYIKYDAYELKDKIKIKTVFINGDNDISTPLEQTRKFCDSLDCPKELKIIDNCEHTMKTQKTLKDLESHILEIIKEDI